VVFVISRNLNLCKKNFKKFLRTRRAAASRRPPRPGSAGSDAAASRSASSRSGSRAGSRGGQRQTKSGSGKRGADAEDGGDGGDGDSNDGSATGPGPVADPRAFVPRMRADEEARVEQILAMTLDTYGDDGDDADAPRGARPVLIPAGEGFAPSEDDARSLMAIEERLARLAPREPGDHSDARSLVSSFAPPQDSARGCGPGASVASGIGSQQSRVTSSHLSSVPAASAIGGARSSVTGSHRTATTRKPDPVREAREEREERERMERLDGEIADVYTRPIAVTEDILRRLILEYHREISGIGDLGAEYEHGGVRRGVPSAVGGDSPERTGAEPQPQSFGMGDHQIDELHEGEQSQDRGQGQGQGQGQENVPDVPEPASVATPEREPRPPAGDGGQDV
jgi:hypothetical protein